MPFLTYYTMHTQAAHFCVDGYRAYTVSFEIKEQDNLYIGGHQANEDWHEYIRARALYCSILWECWYIPRATQIIGIC